MQAGRVTQRKQSKDNKTTLIGPIDQTTVCCVLGIGSLSRGPVVFFWWRPCTAFDKKPKEKKSSLVCNEQSLAALMVKHAAMDKPLAISAALQLVSIRNSS